MTAPNALPPPPLVVDTPAALKRFLQSTRRAKRVAIDTEAASYHRYFDRIYLLQVSTDWETAIVDPLGVKDLPGIGTLLADTKTEVVFHDADYDLRVLDRDYDLHAANVFDTRIAAQLLGEPAIGLGALLEKFLGIRIDKKMQRADWSRRPLTPEMIEYASNDTRYLLSLRDKLEKQLTERGRHHWAKEEFERLERVRWTASAQKMAFLKLKGARKLPRKSLAVLRSLYKWRDRTARKLDRAPFRVLGNDAMVALASTPPQSQDQLGQVKGLPESAVRRYGPELWAAVAAGLETPESQYPKIPKTQRPKMSRAAEGRLERLKVLRNRSARALEIEPGVLCPNGTLQAIARANPSSADEIGEIEELRRWQLEAIGLENLLAELGGRDTGDG